ncbi:MAG: SDR family NAD(P)-dependent oxidoreductase [Planctomycetota bacterium]|nr:SDR family NAD(P)-dependent oxidoreductase [Planctomycetota bacterium]
MLDVKPFSKVLVTGAAGFIGSHLVAKLLANDCQVIGLDNFDPFYSVKLKRYNLKSLLNNSKFELIEGDILNRTLITDIFGKHDFDAVVHLAAKAGVRPSITDPEAYFDVNVRGTLNILSELKSTTNTRLVMASSSSVYGNNSEAPFSEDAETSKAVSPYAASKKAGEVLAHTFAHLHGIPTTLLRFFTVYGPRQRPEMAMANFINLIEAGQMVPMFGDGSSARDYTYVDDIVDGIYRAIERCDGYHIYNLGNSSPISLKEMIACAGEVCGKQPRVTQLADQPGDVELTFADISRASNDLGYQPTTTLRQGLSHYRDWANTHPLSSELQQW